MQINFHKILQQILQQILQEYYVQKKTLNTFCAILFLNNMYNCIYHLVMKKSKCKKKKMVYENGCGVSIVLACKNTNISSVDEHQTFYHHIRCFHSSRVFYLQALVTKRMTCLNSPIWKIDSCFSSCFLPRISQIKGKCR